MIKDKVQFKRATINDLENFYQFFTRSIKEYFPYYSQKSKDYILDTKYTKEKISKAINDGFVLIGFDDDRIIGFLLLMSKPSAGLWDLNWIAIDKDYRNKGIGTKLLQLWEREAISIGVHCLTLQTSNEHELDFYNKRGFTYFGCIPEGSYGNKKYKFYKIIQKPAEKNFLKYQND